MKRKKTGALCALMALCLCLCGCSPAPAPEARDKKLIDSFTSRGMTCERADDVQIADPAIYDASAWYALSVNGEIVYVYFDESNRADYLCSGIDQEEYGLATTFGLRYVLNYRGDNEDIIAALNEMDERV